MESITQNSDAAVRFYRVTAMIVGKMFENPFEKISICTLALPLAIAIPFVRSKLRGFLKLFTKLFMKTLNNLMNPNNWLTFGYKLFPHLYGKCVKISRVHSNVILIVKKKNVAFY